MRKPIEVTTTTCLVENSEWIILRTGGQTMYSYFIPPTSVYTLHMIVRAKYGKDGINISNGDIFTELPCIINNSRVSICTVTLEIYVIN